MSCYDFNSFSYPGLNNLYYKYKSATTKQGTYPLSVEGLQKLTDDLTKADRLATARMVAIFLGYLIPFAVGFAVFLTTGSGMAVFAATAYEIAFLVVNFVLDQRYARQAREIKEASDCPLDFLAKMRHNLM